MESTASVFRGMSKAQMFMFAQTLLTDIAVFVLVDRDPAVTVLVKKAIELVMAIAYQAAVGGQPQDPEDS